MTTVDLLSWEADPARRRRAWIALCVAAASIFLFVLDSGLLSIARPSIEKEFSATPRSIIAWTATGFLVTLASLLLIGGRLSDARGRKRFYLFGVWLFGFGSLCTSLAPTVPLLITARVIGGAGAAFLTSSALALVMPKFPLEKRGMMIGWWGSLGSTAAIVAPTGGALLTEHISWRLPFGLIAPMSPVFIVGGRVPVEQDDQPSSAAIDPVSFVLGPLALGLLVLGVSQGGRWGWGSLSTLTALIASAIPLAFFTQRCGRVSSSSREPTDPSGVRCDRRRDGCGVARRGQGQSLLAPARRVWVMVSLAHLVMCLPYVVRRHTQSVQRPAIGRLDQSV